MLVNINSYNNLYEDFNHEEKFPESDYIRLSYHDIPIFFDYCKHTDRKFTLLTWHGDYSLAYQADFPMKKDIIDFFHWCGDEVEQHIKGKPDECVFEQLILPPRCNPEICYLEDKYSVRLSKFTVLTFNEIPDNIIKWYASNCNINDDRITHIPFGVENPVKPVLQNFEPSKTEDKINKLYVNYSDHTWDRTRCKRLVRNYPWVTVRDKYSLTPGLEAKEYIREVNQHKFNLCLPGYGFDCYRTWETLWLNSIPVMIEDHYNRWMKGKFPVIYFDKIEDIDMDAILVKYNDIRFQFDRYTLTEEYWRNTVLEGKMNDRLK